MSNIDHDLILRLEKFGIDDGKRYSTLSDRIFANVIDGVLIAAIAATIAIMLPHEWLFQDVKITLLVVLFLKCLPYVYSVYFHAKFGRTVGKKIMGLKVIDKSENKEIGFKQAILRDIIPFGGLLCFFLGWIVLKFMSLETIKEEKWTTISDNIYLCWLTVEVVTAAMNKKRRSVHDYIAKTVVIQK